MSDKDDTMSKQPLRLISIIVGGEPYRDRMSLLYALDPHVDEHVILTRDDEGDVPNLHNTHIVKPRLHLRGPLFYLWAGVKAILTVRRGPCNARWLISEHFWWFALLLPRLLMPHRVIACVSLYAPNRSLYLNEAWLADPFIGPVSKAQCHYYAKRYRNHMRLDTVGSKIADAFIVNSENIRQDILQISPRKTVVVMPTSISIHASGLSLIRSAPHTAVTFLYVGLMQPRKGIGLLLEAFAQHSRQRPEDRLVLVGRHLPVDQEWFKRLIAQYNGQGRIEYLPHMAPDELARYYRECDVFLFPSFYEGSPRVVKEAMVFGSPIIANDIPGIRLIDPEGIAIQYVPPGDLARFVRCMIDLASDTARRAELGRLSRTVVSEFSHERVAAQLAAVYREMMDRPVTTTQENMS